MTTVPGLRARLSRFTVAGLKELLRFNHQNPFGTKPILLSRIVQCVQNGCYPPCPKCRQGRLKARRGRRKGQSKYFCPGYRIGFRSPSAFHHCDFQTDDCVKEEFAFPPEFSFALD